MVWFSWNKEADIGEGVSQPICTLREAGEES